MIKAVWNRYGNSMREFVRFGIVGGSGVLVNMLVMIVVAKLFPVFWASAGVPEGEGVVTPILGTQFNVRWYHVFSTVAFLVANAYNFQLNRWWTFKSSKHAGWWKEYWPFLVVGLVALGFGQIIFTALMHPSSPISLPTHIFDGSTGFRSRHYWANLIMIICTIPISFLANKFWTFKSVRGPAPVDGEDAG